MADAGSRITITSGSLFFFDRRIDARLPPGSAITQCFRLATLIVAIAAVAAIAREATVADDAPAHQIRLNRARSLARMIGIAVAGLICAGGDIHFEHQGYALDTSEGVHFRGAAHGFLAFAVASQVSAALPGIVCGSDSLVLARREVAA